MVHSLLASVTLLLTLLSTLTTFSFVYAVSSPTHQNPLRAPALPVAALSDFSINKVNSWNTTKRALSFERRTTSRRDLSPTGALLCSSSEPCADGSCCSNDGICGYGPTYCGSGNCTSNCDATAMCGIYSEDGATKCGMNLCCASSGWCGTTETYCVGADQWDVCQQGMGGCQIITPKTCGEGSGTTEGRTIGYYQASNVYNRACNKIAPSDIKTDGYTHLYFAFASIDPSSFSVVPANDEDVPLYTEFTGLKTSSMQTWIAIGGYDFSDNGTATHTTWSDLASSSANRAAFINSAKAFMDKYGFQGVDLDWEYPGDSTRGGSKADTANFVALVQEMRAAFGSSYGISVTLAPDYWYLRWFDAISMQPYVDWFGFMAYDLHGYWDADVKTLGSIVRGQADIREIYNDTLPLWFDGLDASKINFGVAYYGRGYTLTDPSCNTLGCGFSGPSKPGVCTNTDGVMSLVEIEQLISEKGLTPTLLQDSAMKQLTWDDQWIGYDDADTVALKKQFANNLCFGGTMAWSVDFNSGDGSGLTPNVTTDGSCGKTANGAICGNGFGSCCSASGYCGSTDDYCGSGCQSGNCTVGGITTDGTCGIGHRNFTCGSWSAGSCCSAEGYCGTGDAYCGTGCQSGCDGTGTGLGTGLTGAEISTSVDDGANTNSWRNVTCDYGTLSDDTNDPVQQFIDAKASYAFADCWNAFNQNSKGLNFSNFMANYFHARPGINCESVGSSNCDVTINCGQGDSPNAEVNSPAGYFLINTMVFLHIQYDNFYQGMLNAVTLMDGQIGKFASEFAPQLDELEKDSKVMIDLINLAFSVLSAGVFNSWLKALPFFKANPNTLGVGKDSTNAFVSQSLGITKDTMSAVADLEIQNDLSAFLSTTVQQWVFNIGDLCANTYSDPATLYRGLVNGLFWDPNESVGSLDVTKQAEQALYAYMLPIAWSMAGTEVNPFIATADGLDHSGSDPCSGYDYTHLSRQLDIYFEKNLLKTALVCVDNTAYWLIGATRSTRDRDDICGSNAAAPGICTSGIGPHMNSLPGIDSLDGTNWGGVTPEDLVASAVRAWKNNGNKNGWAASDPTTTDGMSDISDNGIQAIGMVNIPVCSFKEAYGNAWPDTSSDNFPCD